jgi:aromatic-L-amino-acid decarboxylase
MAPGDRDLPDWAAGLGDMDPQSFREAGHHIVDLLADYLAAIEEYAVFPALEPGTIAPQFPARAPDGPEPMETILADYRALVEPNATHWNHPGFMAWFTSANAAPGILGEFLTAGIGQNTFLWRTSPIGTELETVVVGWLRDALGLPEIFDGFLTDTASTSSLIALAAAREAAGLDAAIRGLAAREDIGAPRIYASTQAHSSIDKTAMTLGIGRANVVHIPVDGAYAMRVDELVTAIARDQDAGHRPVAVVATLGTTNTTAIDPIEAIADVAASEDLWLHVDAAYGGSAGLVPELRHLVAGWERAHSIVVNPHKWMAVPFDASLLLTTRPDQLRAAFSVVPEYLRALGAPGPTRDVSEYTPQLGRRFRALKLWVMLRAFGLDGLRRRIAWHVELAADLARVVGDDPDWELVAPVPFSTVCLRWRPADLPSDQDGRPDRDVADRLDAANQAILEAVNGSGEVFISHTRLDGRFVIRVALGHIRAERRHVERAWQLLREAAANDGRRALEDGGQGASIAGKLDA